MGLYGIIDVVPFGQDVNDSKNSEVQKRNAFALQAIHQPSESYDHR